MKNDIIFKMAHIGEIIILQPEMMVAEGKKDFLPSFGTLLKTQNKKVSHYLIVINQFVESKIPGRVPQTYGLDEESIEKEHPHFSYLLGWMFQLVPIAQLEDSHFSFPNRLPPLHSLLFDVKDKELIYIFRDYNLVKAIFKIDEKEFPRRNLCFVNLAKNILNAFPEHEKSDALNDIYTSLTNVLREDFYTLRMIMREIEGR